MSQIVLSALTPAEAAGPDAVKRTLGDVPNADVVRDVLAGVIEGQSALYERTNAMAPWIGYLARDESTNDLVGSCSFIRRAHESSVEIAYFTFPAYEGRGIATEMAKGLLAIAQQEGTAQDLHAFTLPEENASTAVLRRLGFVQRGTAMDDEAGVVWRWELSGQAGL